MAEIVLKPAGVYKGQVLFHQLNESMGGTPFIDLRVKYTHFEDEGGEWAELEEPFTRPLMKYMSPGALPITVQDLIWLGFKDTGFEKLDPSHPDAHSFKGVEVFGKCDHEEYRDKLREKWNLQRRRKAATPDQLVSILSRVKDDFAEAMAATLNPQSTGAASF
jgi:hypothetical protein